MLFTPAGEFRAVWRLLFFAAIAYSSAYVLVVGSRLAVLATGVMPQRFVVRWLFTLILPVALLVAHAASLFAFDRRGWSYVWLGRASFNAMAIARGTVWGALTIGIPTLLLLAVRQFAIYPAVGGTWLGATARTTAMLLPLALLEELIFRGYLFAVLRQAIGWKGALIATSVVFGVAHMQNSGVDPQNIIIVTMAGLFLGLILLATRSLYAAWAAHFAWNWMMACAFHVNVSGNPFERPVYEMVAKGPVWVTGGVWGPEGGIGAAIGLFVGVVYVYGRYLKPLET
jgi:membrane protease YdiL (CAAX protease family)